MDANRGALRAKTRTSPKPRTKAKPEEEAQIQRAIERFRQLLRERGLHFSTVRESIARAVLTYRGHFEANDVVTELRRAGVSDAHLTTVYRNMPLLVEAGLIQQTLLSSGDRHFYEASFERGHHDHLVCTSCGTVVEFEFEAIEVLQRDIAAHYDFELTGHVHELLGICGKCRNASKRKKPSI